MVRKTSGSGVVVHGYEMLGLFIPPPSFLFFVCSCKVCSLSFIFAGAVFSLYSPLCFLEVWKTDIKGI